MTVTIRHTILQLVIEGPAVSYEIVLSSAHDGTEDCFDLTWNEMDRMKTRETFMTLPIALLRVAALIECCKVTGYFQDDFASFIDNAETFLSSNVNPDDLALLYRTHEDD